MALTVLLATTVFLSAFLLFLIQPMAAKAMLPTFGGTSAVWVTSLVFFQTTLLLGYAYADRLNAWLGAQGRVRVHIGLLLASLVFLPLQILNSTAGVSGDASPSTGVLTLLLVTLGLPYLLLSSTGPLLQAVHHLRFPARNVYRLYAISNLASLIALVAYPFTIERLWPVETQLQVWSAAYLLFVLLCGATLWLYARKGPASPPQVQPRKPVEAASIAPDTPPTLLAQARWLGLAALGSALLVATTSHMTQNIASIPLFWVLPLGVYLLSFVITFDNSQWYSHRLALVPVMFAPPLMILTVFAEAERLSLISTLTVNTLGLLVCCWFLHGELAHARPQPRYLTRFYLMLSAGGALGGALASIAAPALFNSFIEFRLLLVVFGVVSLISFWGYLTRNIVAKGLLGLLVLSVGAGALLAGHSVYTDQHGRVVALRNFYAVTSVKERTLSNGQVQRTLYNGNIRHGSQFVMPEHLQRRPGDYYGAHSGIGKLMAARPDTRQQIGVIGLGAGVMASYARADDHFTFFEINPQSIEVAESQFTYLRDARGRMEMRLGDARVELQKQKAAGQATGFDLLAVDAFSGDAIPVHLLTQEALALYLSHLKPDGVLAIHISNKYLDLRPVLAVLAGTLDATAWAFDGRPSNDHEASSLWVMLTPNKSTTTPPAWHREAQKLTPPTSDSDRFLWTDLKNNLFDVMIFQR
ncbi:MAG: fused MFS/spermidine synthase [Ideonella sp.]|nr:fused MFS/spermidine synthase [Ideonella sp.]